MTGRAQRYVFLDIDGVLNSSLFFEEARPLEKFKGCREVSDFDLGVAHIDPNAVMRLNQLVHRGVNFVLSSTWRLHHPLHQIQSMLAYHRFEGLLIGCTPSTIHNRGREIDSWLEQVVEPGEFVILDDDSDMEPHMDRLVQTDSKLGLTLDDVSRAASVLGL